MMPATRVRVKGGAEPAEAGAITPEPRWTACPKLSQVRQGTWRMGNSRLGLVWECEQGVKRDAPPYHPRVCPGHHAWAGLGEGELTMSRGTSDSLSLLGAWVKLRGSSVMETLAVVDGAPEVASGVGGAGVVGESEVWPNNKLYSYNTLAGKLVPMPLLKMHWSLRPWSQETASLNWSHMRHGHNPNRRKRLCVKE